MLGGMDTTTITRMWLTNGIRAPRTWTVRGTAEDAQSEIATARAEGRFARFVAADGTKFSVSTSHLDHAATA